MRHTENIVWNFREIEITTADILLERAASGAFPWLGEASILLAAMYKARLSVCGLAKSH